MSDSSGEELSSLYKSMEKEGIIPKVRQRRRRSSRKRTFQSIFQESGVADASNRNFLDASSELTRLNELLNKSLTLTPSPDRNTFARPPSRRRRRRTSNVFANILKDDDDDPKETTTGGGTSGESSSGEILAITREPLLSPKVRGFPRALAVPGLLDSPAPRSSRTRADSTTESSGSRERSPTLLPPPPPPTLRGRRSSRRRRTDLGNILNPAADDLSSDTSNNRNIPASNSSNREEEEGGNSWKRSRRETGATPQLDKGGDVRHSADKHSKGDNFELDRRAPSVQDVEKLAGNSSQVGDNKRVDPAANLESRPWKAIAHNNNNSSSDLTFDSDMVLHSTLRNTPVVKAARRGAAPEFLLGTRGRRSSTASSAEKQVSEPQLTGLKRKLESADDGRSQLSRLDVMSASRRNRGTVDGDVTPHVESLNSDKGRHKDSEPRKSKESSPATKLSRSRGTETSRVADNSHRVSESRRRSEARRGDKVENDLESLIFKYYKFERTSKEKKPNESGKLERKETIRVAADSERIDSRRDDEAPAPSDDDLESLVFQFDKFGRSSKQKKSNESLPTGKLERSRGKEKVNGQSVSSRVAADNNSERISPDLSGSRRRSEEGTSKPDDKVDNAMGEKDLESLINKYYKFERTSKEKKPNESGKLERSRGKETTLEVNGQSVSSRVAERISSDVWGSRRRSEPHDKVPDNSDEELQSPILKFGRFSKRKESKESLPSGKVERTDGVKRQSLSTLVAEIVSPDSPGRPDEASGQKEPSLLDLVKLNQRSGQRDRTWSEEEDLPATRSPPPLLSRVSGRAEDGERSSRRDAAAEGSSLFDLVQLERDPERKKSKENLQTAKVTRSRGNEKSRPSLVSGRRSEEERSSRRDGESGSSLFNLVQLKRDSEPKKWKENLPTGKVTSRPSLVSNNSGRVSGRSQETRERSSRRDGSPLFHFVKREKSKENLAAETVSRRREEEKEEEESPRRKLSSLRGGKGLSLKKPAQWVNDRFYAKLLPFFEAKFGPLRCFSACEEAALEIHANVKQALRKADLQAACVNKVRRILYGAGVIKTPTDFMLYAELYLPNEFLLIAVPKRVGSKVVGVPYPPGVGLYDDMFKTSPPRL